jgi:hypothetical protein
MGAMTAADSNRAEDAGGPPRDPVEQRLIDYVARGEVLDLAGDGPVDEAAMRSWGVDRTVSASVIRGLVRGRLASDPDPHGVRLRGARITGRIDLENITGDLWLELTECFLPAGVNLRNARLPGVALTGSRIEQPADSDDPPVDADRFAAQALGLDGVTVTADTPAGAVRLMNARLGDLNCDGARLENTTGPALFADDLQVDQSVFLSGGFTATSADGLGTVRLHRAHIGGQLDFHGARLENTTGPALTADGLQVDQSVFLRGGFTASSAAGLGTIRLPGAHIGGQLDFEGARLENTTGPALTADGLQVSQGVFLRGFTATSAAGLGTIRLLGGHIGGQLDCQGARLENTTGPALVADRLQVDQELFLHRGFTATGAADDAVLGLTGARIGGELWLDTSRTTHTAPGRGVFVDLDGLTYSGVPQPASLPRWLSLLREHTPRYAAQPYQQLAAAHRAAGHDWEVRHVLMAQRRDQIKRKVVRGWDRFWARLTGLTLGFGYQPWRALLLLLAVLALSVAAALAAGHHGGLAHTSRSATPNAACTLTEQVGVGLDLGIPLLKTGAGDLCAPTTTAAGQALTIAGWFLQILAWAFAALFIAGFTGAVRKT